MFTEKRHPHSLKRSHGEAGITLLEVVFAAAIFSSVAVISILAFTTFNRFASNIRYQSLAMAAAQQKMDQIMTTPWSVSGTTPTVLTTGSTVEPNGSDTPGNAPSAANPVLPLNNDYWNGTSATGTPLSSGGQILSSTFTSLDTQVIDNRTTVISAVSGNPRMVSVKVTVSYTYRGTPQSITLYSLRATNDF
jgi:type II secretory pathway pseudopilin PulG